MRVSITDSTGHTTQRSFRKPVVLVGRRYASDIHLPKGNVSAEHCRFAIRNHRVSLTDLGSTNGTFLNGQRVHEPRVLSDGDRITIGDVSLTIDPMPAPTDEQRAAARAIALDPRAAPEDLDRLAVGLDDELCDLIVRNPNTPLETLFDLGIAHPAGLWENPALPLLRLVDPGLLERMPEQTLCSLLTVVALPPDFLIVCADLLSYPVREAVAAHARTPVAVLERLADDPNENCHRALARNPSTPLAVLEAITQCRDEHANQWAREALASRRNAAPA